MRVWESSLWIYIHLEKPQPGGCVTWYKVLYSPCSKSPELVHKCSLSTSSISILLFGFEITKKASSVHYVDTVLYMILVHAWELRIDPGTNWPTFIRTRASNRLFQARFSSYPPAVGRRFWLFKRVFSGLIDWPWPPLRPLHVAPRMAKMWAADRQKAQTLSSVSSQIILNFSFLQ